MASRRTPARANGAHSLPLDTTILRSEAGQISHAAAALARMADEVSEGADSQIRSIDDALNGINEMAASLRETASQAETVASSTEELVSSINEVAASARSPTVRPSACTTSRRVRSSYGARSRPNRARRLTTGTTSPRENTTPSTNGGAFGTPVTCSTISMWRTSGLGMA